MVGTPRCGIRTAQHAVPPTNIHSAGFGPRFFCFDMFRRIRAKRKPLFDVGWANGKNPAWQ
jgi:hypothetical protein